MIERPEDRDPRPDPATWSADELEGKTSEERLAILHALQARSEEQATARRGRPLREGDISSTKGDFPVITRLVGRHLPDGTYEDLTGASDRVNPPSREEHE